MLLPGSPQSLINDRFMWFSDGTSPIIPNGAADGPFTVGDVLMVLPTSDATPMWYRCTTGGAGNVAAWAPMSSAIHVTTTDPGTSNDGTQGYQVGSVWFNTTLNREWTCLNNGTGAAVWSFSGASYTSGGYNPPGEVTQAGSSTGTFAEEGNINRQVSGTGVIPGGTGADYVLSTYTLPANAFDTLGRGLALTAVGSFAANGNNKRVKVLVGCTTATVGSAVTGGTVIADTGVIGSGSLGWSVAAEVYKQGAAGSNTQVGLHTQAQYGGTLGSLLAPLTSLAMAENSSILVAVTGNATTNSNDITFNFFQANWMN